LHAGCGSNVTRGSRRKTFAPKQFGGTCQHRFAAIAVIALVHRFTRSATRTFGRYDRFQGGCGRMHARTIPKPMIFSKRLLGKNTDV
jgi:hypothetical protein